MKFIKFLFKALLSILLLLFLVIVIAFTIDSSKTSYLNVSDTNNYADTPYIIKNVNIVPMTKDTVLINKTVRIENGFIKEIGDLSSQTDLKIIDAKGQFLSPGLIDMHVHVWDKQELGLYLANGVTTVRNMWGMPYHLRLKKQSNNNEFLSPIFITSSPKLTGKNDAGIDKVQIQSPEEAKQLISEYKKAGYDVIKTYAGISKPVYDAIVEQSKIEQMPITAHPSFNVEYNYHFKPEFETVEHTEEIVQNALKFEVDSLKLNAIIKLYANNNMSHTPTLSIFQNIIDIMEQKESILSNETGAFMNPTFVRLGSRDDYNRWTSEMKYNPEIYDKIKTQHQQHLIIVKKLHDANVNLVCGTDSGIMFAPAGQSTHEELQYYLEAGLTNYEALATATINPRKVSQLYKDYGTIEVGKMANLILSKENPLENLTTLKTPQTVWIKGRMIDEASINEFKNKAKNRKNGLVTLCRFVESFIQ